LAPAPLARGALVVGRIQRKASGTSNTSNTSRGRARLRSWDPPGRRRADLKAGAGAIAVEKAQRLDVARRQPDLFLGLAQRTIDGRGIARFQLAAGK
jgi:hypothetical protein